jgi:hypothetical protein
MTDPGGYSGVGGPIEGLAVWHITAAGEDEEGRGRLPGVVDEDVCGGDGCNAVERREDRG